MQHTSLNTSPRPRTLIHPGKTSKNRISHRHCEQGRHIRLLLQAGLSLYEALVIPLQLLGINSASTTILGGDMSRLDYCVAPPDTSGKAVISYTAPIRAGSANFIFGNATVGRDIQGKPIVHCHAVFRTELGFVKGGHIITEQSILSNHPISVLVTAFTEFGLHVKYDAETNISLIQPSEVI